jgi:ribosomal protein S8E
MKSQECIHHLISSLKLNNFNRKLKTTAFAVNFRRLNIKEQKITNILNIHELSEAKIIMQLRQNPSKNKFNRENPLTKNKIQARAFTLFL